MLLTRRASWKSKPTSKRKQESCMFLSTSSYDRSIAGVIADWHHPTPSAGQLGPTSPFLNDKEAPEHKPLERRFSIATLLKVGAITLPSIWHQYFLWPLLSSVFWPKALRIYKDIGSSVINITSISGIIKLAQNHVRLIFLKIWDYIFNSNLYTKILLQQCKGGCIASHTTSFDWNWVEKHSRTRKRNRPGRFWVRRCTRNYTRYAGYVRSIHFASTCKKRRNVSFSFMLIFNHLFKVREYLMTVARKWPALSSTLHLVRVGTFTVRRSWLMVVILLSILRNRCIVILVQIEHDGL